MAASYTDKNITEIMSLICKRIAEGESLRAVLRSSGMPSRGVFFEWITSSEQRANQYARATEIRAEQIFEEMLEIADTEKETTVITEKDAGASISKRDHVNHRKLQIDTRKWVLSRMMPKKYGDKIDITSSGDKINSNITVLDETQADVVKDLLSKFKDE